LQTDPQELDEPQKAKKGDRRKVAAQKPKQERFKADPMMQWDF